MRKNLARLYVPLLCMLVLLLLILREQYGPGFEARPAMLQYLESAGEVTGDADDAPAWLVLYNSHQPEEQRSVNELRATLNMLDIPFEETDMAAREVGGFGRYKTVLLCTQSLSPLTGRLQDLSNWVEQGGHFAMLLLPDYSQGFNVLGRKLGVIETSGEYMSYSGLQFQTDLLPMYQNGQRYEDAAMVDSALRVRLSSDCVVHIASGDAAACPILWEKPLGLGRIVVFNGTLVSEKANRGMVLCALFALEDVVAYPIINAGMMFVDDFPAPQPEGKDETLLEAYGYDIQGFFRNHWWPDMKRFVWEYGVRYTGVLVETYNDRVEPPFEPDSDERALLRYYASELIHSGGEIGLHGYNHMPLCPDGFAYAGEGYHTWPSAENMAMALGELYRYGSKALPEAQFVTYVPPSNYLSDLGQKTLLETLPQVRTLSGLYLPEAGVNALVQEFGEEEDGSISVPRVTSGFAMDSYQSLVCAQELLLHGVFSHFIHPDDVLDDDRSGGMSWASMYASMGETLQALREAYPMLRYSTASEGAAAVQRYDRVTVNRTLENGKLHLRLRNRTDEVWLALRTRNPAFTVQGAEVYPVGEHFFWLRTQQDEVTVSWEAMP